MASLGAPPPKRRRTDEGQVSEESIAQANSTLQVFMGQNRQNRWMQGYVPAPRNEQQQQQQQQQRYGAGAMQTSVPSPNVGVNVVQYESPMTFTPLPGNASPAPSGSSRKSTGRMSSGGNPAGLPSPVSSDGNGNTNSPAAMQGATAPRRGPPPSHIHYGGGVHASTSNGSSAAPAQLQIQPQFEPQRQRSARSGQATNMNNTAAHFPTTQDAQHSAHATNPLLYSTSQAQQATALPPETAHRSALLQRMKEFESNVLSRLPPEPVDFGRFSLLREAVERHDWFYICLSQIHCLSTTPALLPVPANQTLMQAIAKLDVLLCRNNQLSQAVLTWLSEFPASTQSIYASPARVRYEKHIQEVTEFLQRLHLHWDKLVQDCKNRGAPPLMDDLHDKLALHSPVLQTTVFRAITRMLIQEPGENLEQLHRMDQEAFARGRRKRTKHEKEQAYQAFRNTIRQLARHQEKCTNVLQSNQRPPPFTIPGEALAVFQVLTPTTPQTQNARMYHFIPVQQQQAPHLNNQAITNVRRPPLSASGSPIQPPTLTQPALTSSGGTIPMPRQQHPPSRRLVFPHESEQPRPQPTQPDTMRTALHQAHLRSPTLSPVKPDQPRLYRHVVGFAVQPRKINKHLPVETIGFDVSQDLFNALPATRPSEQPGEPPTRTLTEKSYTIRLRCVSGAAKALKSETNWMEADNYWPDDLYLQCNSTMLEQRRKLHHGRYLPIDLTADIKSGFNELTVIVNRMSTDKRPYEYALAVEIVGVIDHNAIGRNMKYIPAADSLEAIKASLAPTDDKDDVILTSSTTTIALFDPYTLTKIFDVPVRGADCLHTDCFDLETFLSQREPKNEPGTPSVVDCWRCPICRGDVRPQTLVRDGFMDSVREELGRKKLLDTRAIVVEPDGSWKPKEEDGNGVRSPSLEREERGGSARDSAVSVQVPKPPIEVIEID